MKKSDIANANATLSDYTAKVADSEHSCKDLWRVLDFFRYTTGTTLDCAKSTGILRNSITWYVVYLERENLLAAISVRPDRTTGRRAKHYSADKSLWAKQPVCELSFMNQLFQEDER